MLAIAAKLLLICFGILAQNKNTSAVFSVAAVLGALALSSFNQYFGSKRFSAVSSVAYFAASIASPAFSPYVSLFCFDLASVRLKAAALLALIPIMAHSGDREISDTAFLLLLAFLASLLQYCCEKIAFLLGENKRIRDDSAEFNRILAEKNRNLIEKQNDEIYLVTLKERNRIAREIHDNVGHILSRSLLQTGAAQATNKDDSLSSHLSGLKDTLSLAMDAIRESVHGLKGESIDLAESMRKMTEGLNYKINIDYDMGQNVPNELKYCFLAVLKESLTNIARHSDADHIKISVTEHPAIYQLVISDNGTKKPPSKFKNDGMGLVGMEERVVALNGRFLASYQNGFRIFISVPKKEGEAIN
ncbi:MAG: histidine kinase [Oscillospiraceae bacterium]|nr:histidine kinase [Oscillospiraceae bacterium]